MKQVLTVDSRHMDMLKHVVEEQIDNGKEYNDVLLSVVEKLLKWKLIEKEDNDENADNLLTWFTNKYVFGLVSYYINVILAERNHTPILEFFRLFAQWKKAGYYDNNDFGAFGDLLEAIVRFFSKPVNFVKYSDISVKKSDKVDITIKGVKCEVGHNGKTFTDNKELNYDIVYGVFNNEEQEKIFDFAIAGDMEKLKKYTLSRLYRFDSETWVDCMVTKMESLYSSSSSLYITYGKTKVRYGQAKHYAFKRMIDGENIASLYNE